MFAKCFGNFLMQDSVFLVFNFFPQNYYFSMFNDIASEETSEKNKRCHQHLYIYFLDVFARICMNLRMWVPISYRKFFFPFFSPFSDTWEYFCTFVLHILCTWLFSVVPLQKCMKFHPVCSYVCMYVCTYVGVF